FPPPPDPGVAPGPPPGQPYGAPPYPPAAPYGAAPMGGGMSGGISGGIVGDPNKASGKAIAAGVLGVASIIPGMCLGLIGMIMGVLGIIFGKGELDAIKQGRASRAGELPAKIGLYGGIAGLVISTIAFFAYCACSALPHLR